MATMRRRPIDAPPLIDLELALELYRASGCEELADMLAHASRRNARLRAAPQPHLYGGLPHVI